MTRQEIIDKINDILINDFEINPDLIKTKADLIQEVGLDSLDFVDFVVSIEKKFGVKLISEDFKDVKTIEDLYNLIINKKLGTK
jgi:acyl carrier protein